MKEQISDEEKKKLIKEIVDLALKEKLINRQRISILHKLSDSEKSNRMSGITEKLYQMILEECESIDYKVTAEELLEDVDDCNFYRMNKHSRFFKQKEVFEKYDDHPMQKKLRRSGFLSKNEVKKQKTHNQYYCSVRDAKMRYNANELIKRVQKVEERSDEFYKKVEEINKKIENQNLVDIALCESLENITDTRKVKLIIVLKEFPNISKEELAKLIGVSRMTIHRWMIELGLKIGSKK